VSAYLIINYDVTDAAALAVYRDAATPMLVGPGLGEVVAVTAATVGLPEGEAPGTHTVVLRFDDVDQAQAIYDSEAYQAVIGERLAATTPRFAALVPGF
jgi:uncharacterized protein (DUF1330 family)